MKKHFESKLDIDYSYLEKIVQLEFSVPKLDRNVLQNVIKKCLNNYLSHSKLIVKDDEQEELIKIIMENVKDLRDFKRIINSTFNASFNNMKDLNSLDMLLIETIAMKSPELWNEINNNSTYYISEDRYVYGDEYIYSTEKYNIDTISEIPINSKLASACDNGMIELFDGEWLSKLADKIENL